MAKHPTVQFNGTSNTKYQFTVYNAEDDFTPKSAVYVVTERYLNKDNQIRHRVIYVGQSGNIPERFDDHHRRLCFVQHSANSICLYLESHKEEREAIEDDLIQALQPPCNRYDS